MKKQLPILKLSTFFGSLTQKFQQVHVVNKKDSVKLNPKIK